MALNLAFEVTGRVYSEIAAAVKPHVSKDDTRPVLTAVHLIADGDGDFHLEATDSYSLIRASGHSDDPNRDEPWEWAAADVTVPGVEFLSLKPEKSARVWCTVGDVVEITDGTTTVALTPIAGDDPAYPGTFPDFDEIASDIRPADIDGHRLAMGGAIQFGKLAKLPKSVPTVFTFNGANKPVSFYSSGAAVGDDVFAPVRFRGMLMPIRLLGDEYTDSGWEPLTSRVGVAA